MIGDLSNVVKRRLYVGLVSGVGKHIRDEKYVNAKIGLEVE